MILRGEGDLWNVLPSTSPSYVCIANSLYHRKVICASSHHQNLHKVLSRRLSFICSGSRSFDSVWYITSLITPIIRLWQLEISRYCPILKSDKFIDLTKCFCPISFRPFDLKLIKGVVLIFSMNSSDHRFQFAYKPNRSTLDAIISLIHHIPKTLNESMK